LIALTDQEITVFDPTNLQIKESKLFYTPVPSAVQSSDGNNNSDDITPAQQLEQRYCFIPIW
jgi:hypothetical protein